MDDFPDKVEMADSLLGELEAVEARLSKMQQGLTHSHRLAMLGTLAAIVAHEFNNLLTPIISYSQLAQRHPDDIELLRKTVGKTLLNAERAARICSSMLDFSHDSNESVQADVAEMVDEVFLCMARDPSKDGIKLELDIKDDVCVAMGQVGLQQVLLNLVLNARRVLKQQSGGRLKIVSYKQGDRAIIEVIDSGPGIAEQVLPHIFEPFVTYNADDGEDAQQGTGLGLMICENLISGAGGSIEVASTGPSGTTFRIDLPIAGTKVVQGDASSAASPPSTV